MTGKTARKTNTMDKAGSSPLRRIAAVLDALAASPEGLPLNEVARRLSLPPASAHRILRNLASIGYVEGSGHAPYVLGHRMLRLSQLSVGRDTIAALVAPVLKDIAERFEVSCLVKRLEDRRARLITSVAPERATRAIVQPGNEYPMLLTASGRAIVASQDPSEWLNYARGDSRTAKFTESDLSPILHEVLKRGYAAMDNELDPGVAGLAVPITIKGVGVIYAVGVTGFRDTLIPQPHRDEIVMALKDAASRLARTLTGMSVT